MIKRSYFGFLLFSLGFIFFNVSSAKSHADFHTDAFQEMQTISDEFDLPSLSMAILISDEIAFAQAIGFSDISALTPATINTQYSIGSLAKPMTGLVVAKLVDLKGLDLTAPVGRYVNKPLYTHEFSVRELAAHLAGIPHNTPERNMAEFEEIKDYSSPFEAFHIFENHDLLYSPGSEYRYSSNGYILLSAVVEQVAGENYIDYMSKSLWQTFTMSDTAQDTSLAGKTNEATYYSEYGNIENYAEASKKRDRSFLFGGGGFISTPTDLIKMARATFDDDYLSAESKALLSTPVRLRNGEVNSDNYSLGWRVAQLELDRADDQSENHIYTALHHGGVTDKAATAYLLVIPACKAAVAFATNTVPDQFWKIRGRAARLLTRHINKQNCTN
jgi:CubicO group peptidase (beta-lactamase class C family)